MPVEGFLEDEALARAALSCHLSMDLLCREMLDAWKSNDCWKVGINVLKAPFFLVCEGGICRPNTWAAGVAPSLDSVALVAL